MSFWWASTSTKQQLLNERTNEYCIYWSMLYGPCLVLGEGGGGLFGLKERGFALGVEG